MSFPHDLETAIKNELAPFDMVQLMLAATQMSENYRRNQAASLRFSKLHHAAYAAARMPATLAVVQTVLAELQARKGGVNIKTLLDIGAGPGTAAWAAASVFDHLEVMTLVEKDDGFSALGQRLAAFSQTPCLKHAHWQKADLRETIAFENHDLVIASYSLGELSPESRRQVVNRACHAANQAFMVIEPGTPTGYGIILEIRAQLLAEGFSIIAPCPHQESCPMTGKDWCHFSKRLERPSFHRLVKNVELGFEDEKYSYLIATKEPFMAYESRLVRRPLKRSGHIYLDLCTKEGIKREVITKRNPEAMRRAKKIEWGDVW